MSYYALADTLKCVVLPNAPWTRLKHGWLALLMISFMATSLVCPNGILGFCAVPAADQLIPAFQVGVAILQFDFHYSGEVDRTQKSDVRSAEIFTA